MIADCIRIDAYAQALRDAIRPGAVVMDIGTGPGVMAVLACRFGASRVYAIEPSEVIQVAREVAIANQCDDKIIFFDARSTKITVPVQTDVIVSDMRGILPLFEHHIPSIADARRRFLAPGGTLIPRKDAMWAAVVEAPEAYGKIVEPWELSLLGQDLAAARRRVLNEFRRVRMKPEQLLSAPKLWATLDYTAVDNPDVEGTLSGQPNVIEPVTEFWFGSTRNWSMASGFPTVHRRRKRFMAGRSSLGSNRYLSAPVRPSAFIFRRNYWKKIISGGGSLPFSLAKNRRASPFNSNSRCSAVGWYRQKHSARALPTIFRNFPNTASCAAESST